MLEHARARIFIFEPARARSMLDFFILDATLVIICLNARTFLPSALQCWYGQNVFERCYLIWNKQLKNITNSKNQSDFKHIFALSTYVGFKLIAPFHYKSHLKSKILNEISCMKFQVFLLSDFSTLMQFEIKGHAKDSWH